MASSQRIARRRRLVEGYLRDNPALTAAQLAKRLERDGWTVSSDTAGRDRNAVLEDLVHDGSVRRIHSQVRLALERSLIIALQKEDLPALTRICERLDRMLHLDEVWMSKKLAAVLGSQDDLSSKKKLWKDAVDSLLLDD